MRIDLLVINKARHDGPPSRVIIWDIKCSFSSLSGTLGSNGKLRPGIVHRIDKDTSGLLMLQKQFCPSGLAQQLKEQTLKGLLALTEGVIMEPGGIIDAPIGRHPVDRKNGLLLKTLRKR